MKVVGKSLLRVRPGQEPEVLYTAPEETEIIRTPAGAVFEYNRRTRKMRPLLGVGGRLLEGEREEPEAIGGEPVGERTDWWLE